MSDAVRRAIRTFLQAFVGAFVIVAVPWATNVLTAIINAKPYELDFNVLQSAGLAGVFAGAISLVSWIQNALEDKTGVPAIQKAPASEGQNPVPDDAAQPPQDLGDPGPHYNLRA